MNINKAIQSAFEYHRKGDLNQAEYFYKYVLKKQPDNSDILNMLGTLFCQRANYDLAIKYIRKALHFKPTDIVGAYYNLGLALQGKGLLDEAITYYQKAIGLNPFFVEAYCNLGLALIEEGLLDEAITYSQKAVELNPSFAGAYCNLGLALIEKGLLDEAITYSQKAVKLNPSFAEAYCNLGVAFERKGLLDEAITYSQKAIELNPSFANAYRNLGSAFEGKGQFDKAITYSQKAIDLNPYLADAHLNISIIFLLLGKFKVGWEEYEWRWKTKALIQHRRNFSKPLWNGSEIRTLTMLLQSEQGLGDTIQFIRYAPLIAQKGAKVIVECQKELVSLVINVDGVQQVIKQGEELPAYDLYCPLLSLPLIFNTALESIPTKVPYIKVDSLLVQKWSNKVQHDDSKLKIGLVWSGRPEHKKDRNRSCSLDNFHFWRSLVIFHCTVYRKVMLQNSRRILLEI